MVDLARTLSTQRIAEGVETVREYAALRDRGIRLMRSYLFASPAREPRPRLTFLGDRKTIAAFT